MNVIPPLTITDARLISSTVSEPDAGSPSTEQVYSASATYALGAIAINTTTHLKYESLVAGNTGNALTDETKWFLLGATNKGAMFDFLRSTATESPTSLTVVIAPGERINSLALLGLVGSSVTVSMDSALGSPSTNYYYHTEDLTTREAFDWYSYFFKPFAVKHNVVLFDLPPYAATYITITIAGNNVECAACVLGSYTYIGQVLNDAVSDVLNFSTVTRDFAGGTNAMVQRRNVPKTNQTLLLDKTRVNAVRALRDELNATPAVWVGIDVDTDGYFEALLILGFYKQFSINLSMPEQAVITLELEEI